MGISRYIKHLWLAAVLLGHSWMAYAQGEVPSCALNFCAPGTPGMAPGKGLEVSYELLPSFNFVAKNGPSTTLSRVNYNRRRSVKLKLPVLLKPRHKVLAGAAFYHQEYRFEDPERLSDAFTRSLEDKSLKRFETQLFYLHSLDARHYIGLRATAGFNGDFAGLVQKEEGNMDFSFSGLYVTKASPLREYGFGLAAGYRFGRFRPIPLFLYNQTFDAHWGVELLLPAKAQLRYNFSPRSLLLLGAQVEGSNYLIDVAASLPGSGTASLRGPVAQAMRMNQRGLRLGIEWERKLAPMVWISLRTGYLATLPTEFTGLDNQPMIIASVRGTWFTGVSLSVRAPQK